MSNYPEWVHAGTQINFLQREFWRQLEKAPSNCVVIIGIELLFAQIDMLVIKDNMAVILELKNYSATIYADCSSQNVLWKNERGLRG
jgi:hypothetical protein